MEGCPKDCGGYACGARVHAIEGDFFVGPNGERCQVVQCEAGHKFGVAQTRQHGPCPSCGHRWAEFVRAPRDEFQAAPAEAPKASNLDQLAAALGLGGCV